jgi:hypothetical protein
MIFPALKVCCVMLNEVKHLLYAFLDFRPAKEYKSRFFVAEFTLSMAEGLLRMTYESNNEHFWPTFSVTTASLPTCLEFSRAAPGSSETPAETSPSTRRAAWRR